MTAYLHRYGSELGLLTETVYEITEFQIVSIKYSKIRASQVPTHTKQSVKALG